MNEFSGCPISDGMKVLKGKWRVTILMALEHEPKRYNELKRICTGITNTMLNRSLKELEQYDYVGRADYSKKALHVEYYLTLKGIRHLEKIKLLNNQE